MGPTDGAGNPVLPAAVPPVAPVGAAPAPVPVAPPPATIADAARAVGEAQGAADQQIADAEKEAATQNTQLVQREAQMQAEHAAAMRQANQETADAFKSAREMEPTGFWEGRGGREVHAAIAVGLGRVAQVLGHMANNSTADIIQSNIDRHYREEKDKIDRAFQFAVQKGKLTGEMRDQYAQELLALQAARNATTAASAEKIRAVTAASQGKVDKAKAELEAQKLEKATADGLLKDTELRANIIKTKAQTAKEYADIAATKQRLQIASDEEKRKQDKDAADKAAKEAKAAQTSDKEFEKRAGKVETLLEGTARSPGVMMLYRNTDALSREMTEAIKSGDKQRAIAAVMAIEQGSRALSGSAPTQTSTHLLTQDLKSFGDYLTSQWGRLVGNPTASPEYVKRLRGLVDMAKREKLDIAKAAVSDFETKENTLGLTDYGKKRIEGFKKVYAGHEGGQTGTPVTVKLKDGTTVKALKMPDGKLVRAE